MPNILQTIKQFLIYKEPTQSNPFEFLEKENEGQDTVKPKISDTDMGKANDNNRQSPPDAVDPDININLTRIRQEFNLPKNVDIIIREFKLAKEIKAFIIYIDGMVDRNVVNNFILRPLMEQEYFDDSNTVSYVLNNVLTVNDVKRLKEYDEIISKVINGLTALFIDGCKEAITIETKGFAKRDVEKPSTEVVIHGSMESFTEDLRTNITLIRRIIRNKNLISEIMPIGKTNNSSCSVMYLDGLANPAIVDEVKRRIANIDIGFLQGDGMLEQLIEDSPTRLLPQILSTERPDRAASFIMQGQIAIVVDGTPFADVLPITFFSLFHTSEDTNARWQWGTALRTVRLLALILAALLPALYVAITLYHQDMLPTELLISIAKSKENIPFPTVIEVLIMEISFELIREAGVRVPGIIGQTLGIIGALILGQAAVSADIVSPVLIIVVAVTGLGSFAIPNYSLSSSIRLSRFMFIFFGAIAGFYGISIAIFISISLACNLKSFGVPFFSPVAPKTKSSGDLLIRMPLFMQTQRPDYINPLDRKQASDTPRGWVNKRNDGENK